MYLAGNAYPEIQYAVHQCARFTHAPRKSHAVAVKRIARYLVGVLEDKQGLNFKTTTNLNLDLYKAYLSTHNLKIETARDGRELLEKAKKIRPDLIVSAGVGLYLPRHFQISFVNLS